MLNNNNLKICRRLILRDIKFHKGQYLLSGIAVMLVCMLYTFTLCLGNLTYDGFIYSYKMMYGSNSHILFYDLTPAQAVKVENHRMVRESVSLFTLGTLHDEMLGVRNVKLAVVSPGWAKETASVPLTGHMPREKGEIALDEITMNSLAIPHEIGTEVSVTWTQTADGSERTDRFILCGFWENRMGETETCAWVTQETALALGDVPDQLTLGVMLYSPTDPENQAREILSDLGIQEIRFTTNLACNEARKENAGMRSMKFYRLTLIVALCGLLLLFQMEKLLAGQNIRFYGLIKSLGMTPRQLRVLSAVRAILLSVTGILPGWIAGFMICAFVAPHVMVGMEENPAFFFLKIWPFPAAAILTFLTVFFSCLPAIRSAIKNTPVEMLRYEERDRKKRRKAGRRRTSLFLLALSGLFRQKGRFVAASVSLLISLSILCCIQTIAASYDETKYLQERSLFDYRIADASAAASMQRYNPKSRSITRSMYEALAAHPAVREIGMVCTMEVPMHADLQDRAQIVAVFEETDENGIARKEHMSDDPDWMTGYETMRESGDYIGIVTGVNGLTLKRAVTDNLLIEGSFCEELFATGQYVVAAGSSSTLKDTPPAGSKVMISGREFEIMASVPWLPSMISGMDSKEAQFNVTYFMPVDVFEELFPDHGIRNVAVNIDQNGQDAFEQFLTDLLQDTGADVISVKDHQWVFHNAVFHSCMIPFFVGSVMLFIGLLSFVNAQMMGILVRKKEFAVYESLGMTVRQLRRLLFLEGVLYQGAMFLLVIPSVAAFTYIAGQWWLAHTNVWCVTWQYSLTPLWLTLPLLSLISFAVSFGFLRSVTKESVTERLRIFR